MKLRLIAIVATAAVALSACSAEKALDNTVDATLFAGRTVAKTGVGAGKLVVRGANAAVGGDAE